MSQMNEQIEREVARRLERAVSVRVAWFSMVEVLLKSGKDAKTATTEADYVLEMYKKQFTHYDKVKENARTSPPGTA